LGVLTPGPRRTVHSGLVDTGAGLSWIPEEVLDALQIERYARSRLHVAGKRATWSYWARGLWKA
jgi:hypothetical protein